MANNKEEFIKNYTGIYDPEKMYDYQKAVEHNEKTLNGATYNENYNQQLLRTANNAAFEKHLRKSER